MALNFFKSALRQRIIKKSKKTQNFYKAKVNILLKKKKKKKENQNSRRIQTNDTEKTAKYLFLIGNRGESSKQDKHWCSILDIEPKK